MLRFVAALAVLSAGCSAPRLAPPVAEMPPRPGDAPTLSGVSASVAPVEYPDPAPVLRLAAGSTDTLVVGDWFGGSPTVTVPTASGAVRAQALPGGWLAVAAEDGAAGLFLVPLALDGDLAVLAVEVPSAVEGSLRVRVVGTSASDPSQLRLAVRVVAPDGAESLPAELDDEEGVVALDGNRVLDDNAVYFDPDSGELAVDLDALRPGRRRLRVAARGGARVSPWIEVEIVDHRAASVSPDASFGWMDR